MSQSRRRCSETAEAVMGAGWGTPNYNGLACAVQRREDESLADRHHPARPFDVVPEPARQVEAQRFGVGGAAGAEPKPDARIPARAPRRAGVPCAAVVREPRDRRARSCPGNRRRRSPDTRRCRSSERSPVKAWLRKARGPMPSPRSNSAPGTGSSSQPRLEVQDAHLMRVPVAAPRWRRAAPSRCRVPTGRTARRPAPRGSRTRPAPGRRAARRPGAPSPSRS